MSDTTPEHKPVEPPASAGPGDGRYVNEPEGEDPRDSDRLHDADVAARLERARRRLDEGAGSEDDD